MERIKPAMSRMVNALEQRWPIRTDTLNAFAREVEKRQDVAVTVRTQSMQYVNASAVFGSMLISPSVYSRCDHTIVYETRSDRGRPVRFTEKFDRDEGRCDPWTSKAARREATKRAITLRNRLANRLIPVNSPKQT